MAKSGRRRCTVHRRQRVFAFLYTGFLQLKKIQVGRSRFGQFLKSACKNGQKRPATVYGTPSPMWFLHFYTPVFLQLRKIQVGRSRFGQFLKSACKNGQKRPATVYGTPSPMWFLHFYTPFFFTTQKNTRWEKPFWSVSKVCL